MRRKEAPFSLRMRVNNEARTIGEVRRDTKRRVLSVLIREAQRGAYYALVPCSGCYSRFTVG